jgi:sugar lactone lactonase YvrE
VEIKNGIDRAGKTGMMKLNQNMKTLWGKLLGLGLGLWAFNLSAQPVITNQPASQMVVYGGNATLSVMVTGVGPFTYQWQMNGTNLPNNIITTVAGNGNEEYSGDGGMAINGGLFTPYDVILDNAGNLIIADSGNRRIRKVDTNGIITTVAGNGTNGYSGDGGPATKARLAFPSSVAMDFSGNLYIADENNNCVRKVDTNGIITTVAGNGIRLFSGDGGPATNANLSVPFGVAVDSHGNLFIADLLNNRIRKVDMNGIITSVAGNGTNGYSGDGGAATNADLSSPEGVAVDTAGNLFIAVSQRIRKVDTNGIITTVAGNGTGYSGDGVTATNTGLNAFSVTVDGFGNLFIPDNSTRIREVTINGIITTVVGDGKAGYSADGVVATNASLFGPSGVAIDASGNLFFADQGYNHIRKVTNTQGPTLALNNATAQKSGNYSVIITSASGSVTSSVVSVNVQLPPIAPVFTASNGICQFTWSAVSNLTYQLQSTTNLAPPNWQDLGSPITATNNSVSTTNGISQDGQRFYRVRLWP